MRVAITTDWLNPVGGAERVLAELHGMFPEAPIYISTYHPSHLSAEMREWDLRPSFLQRLPALVRKRYQLLLPLMPMAFEEFDLREYDLVLTTNSACAKGVITTPDTVNVCYCYTPCRYLWDLYHDYARESPVRPLFAPVAHWLRMWDRLAADRVDHFVAISHEVAGRIQRHYRRDAEVVHPPVDVDRFTVESGKPDDYYLVVSRLVPYKRVDLAVQAATRLGRRLLVVGDGPERRRLETLAGPTVEFLGRREDQEIATLYARCRALIFPGWEDFGIVPVEAQAAGRPVVAFGRGGATETVVDGRTGVLFDAQTVEAVVAAMLTLERSEIDPHVCRRNAERFDASRFRSQLEATIDRQMQIGRQRRSSHPVLAQRVGWS
jgi:glycosyltransferase involved in cell wall biosynthesis